MIVYKTTNLINNKIYIGQTNKNENNSNYFGSGIEIAKALLKYGRENFNRETLFESTDQEEIDKKEIELILKFNCNNRSVGYNISITPNRFHSCDGKTNEKIRKSKQGKKHTEKHNKKISEQISGTKNPMYGKHHTEETKRKIGLANSIRQLNTGNGFYGKKHNKETRKKLSEIHTGMKHTQTTIEKIKNAHVGKMHTEETKRKMSEGQHTAWEKRKNEQKIVQSHINVI